MNFGDKFMKISVVGAGCDLGVHVYGARYGAKTIIDQINDDNIEKAIIEQDEKIIKSFDSDDLMKNLKYLNEYNHDLYDVILKFKNNDKFVITIGGDHSTAIPSVLSSCKKYEQIGLLWVDAHPDFNSFDTTITGNLHGLPCAAVANFNCNKLTEYHDGCFVNPKNIVIIGARSIDKGEIENLKKAGVTVITTADIKKNGVLNVMKKAFKIALKNVKYFHVSFDLDVIDPVECPGVSVPEVCGISKEEAFDIFNYLLKYTQKMVSFDIMEFNPVKDIDNKTLDIALYILNALISELRILDY